jgi:hypothetical protein
MQPIMKMMPIVQLAVILEEKLNQREKRLKQPQRGKVMMKTVLHVASG